ELGIVLADARELAIADRLRAESASSRAPDRDRPPGAPDLEHGEISPARGHSATSRSHSSASVELLLAAEEYTAGSASTAVRISDSQLASRPRSSRCARSRPDRAQPMRVEPETGPQPSASATRAPRGSPGSGET